MIDLGLRDEEQRALRRALRRSHHRRIRITLRNRDEEPLTSLTTSLSHGVKDGQVMGDVGRDVTRSCSLTVLDPEGRLRFEGDSPAEGAVYANRFVSVEYGVFVREEIDDWVDVPVFWGPVTDFARMGAEVQLEAQGKERLMLEPHFATTGYTIPRSERLDDAIRMVGRRAGERRFNLPSMSRKLRNPRTVRAESEPWKVITGGERNAKGRAISGLVERANGNKHAFYDGRGRLTVRSRNTNPVLTVTDQDIVADSGINYDALQAINTVIVRGAEPQGKGKRRARAKVTLPDKHPLSPKRLARNGEPRHMTVFVDTELETDSLCRERGLEVLRRRSHQMIDAELRVLPVPMVEELDVIRYASPEWDFDFPLRYWVLPLTPGQPMTLSTRRRADRYKWRRRIRAVSGPVATGRGQAPKRKRTTVKAVTGPAHTGRSRA